MWSSIGKNHFENLINMHFDKYGDYWQLNMRLVDEKRLFPKYYSPKLRK